MGEFRQVFRRHGQSQLRQPRQHRLDRFADVDRPGQDLLVVTERDRVWLTRASTIMVVRYAARRGHELCPNYFLAEHALHMDGRDLYGAHELAQMVPVTGGSVYRRLREANPWITEFLPNASGAPLGGRARRRPGR